MSPYTFFRAVLFMGCFFVLLSCENTKEEVDAAFGKKAAAVEEAIDVDSYLSQEGKTKARLTAPYMLRQVSDSQFIEFHALCTLIFTIPPALSKPSSMPNTENTVNTKARYC